MGTDLFFIFFFGLILLIFVLVIGGFGTRKQDCAINTIPEQAKPGPGFPGVTADFYYGSEYDTSEEAQPLPTGEMYTYSRENAAEEFQDMNSHEGVIDAQKYGMNYWYVPGSEDKED